MSLLAQLVLALAIFAAGGATGIKWQIGVHAQAQLAADDARASDARRQIRTNDKAATRHAGAQTASVGAGIDFHAPAFAGWTHSRRRSCTLLQGRRMQA